MEQMSHTKQVMLVACGHQNWEGGQPNERVKMSRIQVLAIRAVCHLLHETYSEDFRSWFDLCN